MLKTHRVEPVRPLRLSEITTRGKTLHPDRDAAEAEFRELRGELAEWQRKLYAEGRRKLLVVLQAMDAGGKDGTIRKVFSGVNPQGVRVVSFKQPSDEELARDFLWRVHKEVPAAGMIRVFNRSHYEDVLVVRVQQIAPERVWRPRYRAIQQFERLLARSGTRIVKFYLHISKKEQRKRFQERLEEPDKHYKFSLEDIEKRKSWDAYQNAYEEAIARCSTEYAPWYVIPADQKWYRNLAVARVLVGTLREMDPQFPSAVHDISNVVID